MSWIADPGLAIGDAAVSPEGESFLAGARAEGEPDPPAVSPTGRTPRAFWTPALQQGWERMVSQNHPWWQMAKDNADLTGTPDERWGDIGQWGTLVYQITGEVSYARKAIPKALEEELAWFGEDTIREDFIARVWMFDWLYPAMTNQERQQALDRLYRWADLSLGKVPHGSDFFNVRTRDSDYTLGAYFGLALLSLTTKGMDPRADTLLDQTWSDEGEPKNVGRLVSSGANLATMRNAITQYVASAKGGVWIESAMYNLGTLSLLFMGAQGVKTATGIDYFPEITQYAKDLALLYPHFYTPGSLSPGNTADAVQWGDEYYHHVYAAATVGGNLMQNGTWDPPPAFNYETTQKPLYLPGFNGASDTIIRFDRVNAVPPTDLDRYPSAERDEWSLWSSGRTLLRGANIFQAPVWPELDGDWKGPGPVGPPFTQADFDALAAAGANYVNISHPGLFAYQAPYALDQGAQQNLDNLLAMIAQADMFAVIGFRTGPGRSEFTNEEPGYRDDTVWESQAAQDAWAQMWRYTAERYRDNPVVIGYDLMVEPNAAGLLGIWEPQTFYAQYANTLRDWNRMYPPIVAAIRQVDADTPLLVGGEGFSLPEWLPHIVPTSDPRTVYTIHQYEPHLYTHQEVNDNRPYPGNWDIDYDSQPDQFDAAWLDARLSVADTFTAQHGAPVAANEYGLRRWAPGGAEYLTDQLQLFEQHGLNHAIWSWNPYYELWNAHIDDFDYRHGSDPNNHTDVADNPLMQAITRNWAVNTVRPSNWQQLADAPPTLDAIPDPVAIDEDAGQQAVNLTGISAGGGESQPLVVRAVSANPGLIPHPAVNYTSPNSAGSLAYTPVPDQSGQAVITVTVTDAGPDGDLATSADNQSLSRSFTVTVTAINDAPSVRGPIAAAAARFPTSEGAVLVDNWLYRLQGENGDPLLPDPLAAAPHDMVVMDFSGDGTEPAKFTPQQIDDIQHSAPSRGGDGHRKLAAAYVSIGEASEFRSYWNPSWTDNGQASGNLTAQAPSWLGPVNPDWPESRKVRYWDGPWQDLIFHDAGTGWLDQVVRQGFDAAYLDIVDAYYFWGVEVDPAARRPGDPPLDDQAQEAGRRMIDFVVAMTNHARRTNPNFFVIPQNGVFLLNDALQGADPVRRANFLDAIGAIAIEDTYFTGALEENNEFNPDNEKIQVLKRDFLAAGKPVLVVDYLNDQRQVNEFYRAALADGFHPHAAPSRGLDVVGPVAPHSLPAELVVAEEANLAIAGITLSDVDAADAEVSLTLSVAFGSLTVRGDVSGGIEAGAITNNATATVELRGSLEQINTTLADPAGLVYQGNPDFNGSDTLTATVNDLGHTGSGGPKSDTNQVAAIAVKPWHNAVNPTDVDGNTRVEPLDVLTLINYINAHPSSAALPAPPAAPPPYYDVNGDQRITPLDVLIVINYINAHAAGAGEAEAANVAGTSWAAEGACSRGPVSPRPAASLGETRPRADSSPNTTEAAVLAIRGAAAALPLATSPPEELLTADVPAPDGWKYSPFSNTHYDELIQAPVPGQWGRLRRIYRVGPGVAAVRIALCLWRGDHVDADELEVREAPGAQPETLVVPAARLAALADGSGYEQRAVIPGQQIELRVTYRPKADHIRIEGEVRDTSSPPRDRAVEVSYTLPLETKGWSWHDDLRRRRAVVANKVYNYDFGHAGHRVARYPFSCVTGAEAGLAMAVPMDYPAMQWAELSPRRGFSLSWDLGLAAQAGRANRGRASFSLAIYAVDPQWGFRSAAAGYYRIFPESFTKRAKREGCWLWPTAPSEVSRPEDFGLIFWEASSPTRASSERAHALGLYVLTYIEPCGIRQWFPKVRDAGQLPSEAEALQRLQAIAADKKSSKTWFGGPRGPEAVIAQAILNSLPESVRDRPLHPLSDEYGAWAKHWYTNPSPYLKKPNRGSIAWDSEIAPSLDYADGVYVDSVSLWTIDYENSRKEHLAAAQGPLSFSRDTARPSLPAGLSYRDLLAYLADELHRRDKLLMLNIFADPPAYRFYAHLGDVLGSEVSASWTTKGRCLAQVESDALCCLRRTYAYRKPVANLLQEGNWNKPRPALTRQQVEQYIQHQLFYGFYPGISTIGGEEKPGYATWKRYFGSSKQCDRDRDLFVKYIPLLRRLNQAGWEPVTYAQAGTEDVLVERFGAWSPAGLYFTVRNPAVAPQRARLSVDLARLGVPPRDLGRLSIVEMVSGRPVEPAGRIAGGALVLELPLEGFQTAVVHLAPAK